MADPEDVHVLLRRDDGAPLPTYARPGDAGLDLATTEEVTLPPGGRSTVGTGVAVALPAGTAAFVLPRSGLAARHGVTVLNAPGTVDAGYRGEIRVTLLNTDTATSVTLHAGDRVAQLVVMALPTVHLVEVDRLPGSDRGEHGFGSTGRGTLTPAPGTAAPAAPAVPAPVTTVAGIAAPGRTDTSTPGHPSPGDDDGGHQ